MIAILGESGSGKSTLLNKLTEHSPSRFKKVIYYTTRPKRQYEIDCIDYVFVDRDIFLRLNEDNFFATKTTFKNWKYGIAKEDITSNNPIPVCVVNPTEMRELKRNGVDIFSVYLKVDRRSRIKKLIDRGDDIDEAYRRNLSDVGQFHGVENEVDLVLENNNFELDENQVLSRFLQLYYLSSK